MSTALGNESGGMASEVFKLLVAVLSYVKPHKNTNNKYLLQIFALLAAGKSYLILDLAPQVSHLKYFIFFKIKFMNARDRNLVTRYYAGIYLCSDTRHRMTWRQDMVCNFAIVCLTAGSWYPWQEIYLPCVIATEDKSIASIIRELTIAHTNETFSLSLHCT